MDSSNLGGTGGSSLSGVLGGTGGSSGEKRTICLISNNVV